ncbi:hypothetical protein BAUCODRAFT_544123 [Baudoinia panamericana UAMH 10762]|uniref:Glycylpeptide N-tetradecanoyltransferase n=1 Tax=Baudoinia panamericana (strain UAMH 10762) TaxID=717646 RepID=M2LJ96_BAUPA|nr:uncharacterized protein BAUCODRAFT_544123 [Baudoinia panamericana UAMH 10762]EMC94307.1 hypothetical protein BAUCODRAFT_544123 [Baudoinia panamericana UAMH 10762]
MSEAADVKSANVDVGAEPKLASDLADQALDGTAQTNEAAEVLRDGVNEDEEDAEAEEEDEEEAHADAAGGAEADDVGTAAGATKARKKRKSKKKKKKAADPTTAVAAAGTEPKVQHTSAMPKPVPANDIPSLLQQLALSQPSSARKEGKAPEDYKFWNTQPVPKLTERREPNLLQTTNGADADGKTLPEGAILPDEGCRASVKPEPERLLEGFEWCLVDLDNTEELQELYELLYNHYVEDTDGSFRFNYSPRFLAWSLKPPGWRKEWHIGVRTKSADDGKKGKLIAFIAGIPVRLKIRQKTLEASEINFLTVHRKLRSKRLAPVLIKEVTRRCYQNGIYQALYTAGTLLPTPISTCRYFHRSLDWEHLYKTGFSHLPQGTTELRQKLRYRLESHTGTKGLRRMEKRDVKGVRELLGRYLERFDLRQEFSEEEIDHWLCSHASNDVVWSFVVEQDGKLTDFFSYYLLESTVLKSNKKETIRAAYLYYYATDVALSSASKTNSTQSAALQQKLQARLQLLIHDALVLANKEGFHVFNALTLLDNPLFLRDQKFEPGDGKLNFYLFNWRTALLPGGVGPDGREDVSKMGGVGVVML